MSDVVERLRQLAEKTGAADPGWAAENRWCMEMRALVTEAADEIERLRSLAGAVSVGASLSDLKLEQKVKQDKVVGS